MGALLRTAALPVSAALLLVWSLMILVPAGTGGIRATTVAVLSATTLLITLLAIPVITLAARRHRWASVVAAAVAAVLPWVFVVPFAADNQPAPAAAEPTELRLMVVNAQEGGASAPDVVAAVTGNSIDVLVVTELTNELAHDLTVAGLDRQVAARWVRLPSLDGVSDDPAAGMGVWTKEPLTGDPGDVPGTTWPAVTFTLSRPVVTVIAGHVATPLPSGGRQWAGDLRALRAAARSAPDPVVLLGNLNATPLHADLRAYAGAGLRDAADVLGQGPRPTWPTWSPLPLLSLDHIMVGEGVGVGLVGTVVIDGSDHRGLLASVRVPAQPGPAAEPAL